MKNLQKKVKDFCEEHGLESPPEHQLLDTFSELGGVAKEVLKMSNYGRDEFRFREEVRGELGDVLYSLITVANSLDVDLEDELEKVLEKYKKRMKKGTPDSEND